MWGIVQTVRQWLAAAGPSLELSRHVHVTHAQGATGDQTRVQIDHRIPSHDSGTHVGWRITTSPMFLPRAHFDADVRHEINTASSNRGRRLYCVDQRSGEVVAVISYHVDARKHFPVILTAIGLRIDEDGDAQLFDKSRGAAFVLKQYVHEIARQLERGQFVDIDVGSDGAKREAEALGFRPAPRVNGLRVSGTHLRQPPLSA
jgi:hypothetical protein